MKNYQSQLIKAQNYEKKQLAEKFKLAQQIGTTAGFYMYFFDTLGTGEFETRKECFHNVNDLHLHVFGQEKYSDYNSFRQFIKNYRNSKN